MVLVRGVTVLVEEGMAFTRDGPLKAFIQSSFLCTNLCTLDKHLALVARIAHGFLHPLLDGSKLVDAYVENIVAHEVLWDMRNGLAQVVHHVVRATRHLSCCAPHRVTSSPRSLLELLLGSHSPRNQACVPRLVLVRRFSEGLV